MALSKTRTRINIKGGGTVFVRCISGTGGGIAEGNTYHNLGYLNQVVFNEEPTMVDEINDQGYYIDTFRGIQKPSFVVTLDQTGKDEIDMPRLADGQYYELYMDVVLENGDDQEWSVPLCKLLPNPNLTFAAATKRQLVLTFAMLAPVAAFTRAVAAFNVVANQPYILIQNATQQMTVTAGVPNLTDQAAMKAAIM